MMQLQYVRLPHKPLLWLKQWLLWKSSVRKDVSHLWKVGIFLSEEIPSLKNYRQEKSEIKESHPNLQNQRRYVCGVCACDYCRYVVQFVLIIIGTCTLMHVIWAPKLSEQVKLKQVKQV